MTSDHVTSDYGRGWTDAREHFAARIDRLESALKTIRGPGDSGPWILIYQEAGGGYRGLQAIAEKALEDQESRIRASLEER